MQRLGSPQHGGQCLKGYAGHVVVWLLCRERYASGLCMGTQQHGPRILRVITPRDLSRPNAARGSQLGDLFKKIAVHIKEKGKPRCKVVD